MAASLCGYMLPLGSFSKTLLLSTSLLHTSGERTVCLSLLVVVFSEGTGNGKMGGSSLEQPLT